MVNKAKEILEKYGQTHVLNSYERLAENKKEELVNQVLSIDFEKIADLYEKTKVKPTTGMDVLEPMPYVDANKLSDEEKENYMTKGDEIIGSGKYAVVMVAGGQGTRLGHNGPKGTFDMGLESHKSLFELFCDKLKVAKDKY